MRFTLLNFIPVGIGFNTDMVVAQGELKRVMQ